MNSASATNDRSGGDLDRVNKNQSQTKSSSALSAEFHKLYQNGESLQGDIEKHFEDLEKGVSKELEESAAKRAKNSVMTRIFG